MKVTWRGVVVSIAVGLALGSTACSSNDGNGETSPTVAPDDGGAADATVTAQDFEFSPSTVTIPSGGSIEITNAGEATHSFTMDDESVSEDLEPGQTVTVTIATAGSFHCRFHAQMTGTVEFG